MLLYYFFWGLVHLIFFYEIMSAIKVIPVMMLESRLENARMKGATPRSQDFWGGFTLYVLDIFYWAVLIIGTFATETYRWCFIAIAVQSIIMGYTISHAGTRKRKVVLSRIDSIVSAVILGIVLLLEYLSYASV